MMTVELMKGVKGKKAGVVKQEVCSRDEVMPVPV